MVGKFSAIVFSVFGLLFLSSCIKEEFPIIETIEKSGKWGLNIGDSVEDVYFQLQVLGLEKNFNQVSVLYRKPYTKPEDVRDALPYYNALTMERNDGQIQRTYFELKEEKVLAIHFGGGLLEELDHWPLEVNSEMAIAVGDSIDVFYQKLLLLYQQPSYQNYILILPGKPLSKDYDSNMGDYSEWGFTFFVDKGPSTNGRSTVRLYFNDEKLDKIQHTYEEFEIVR